MPSRDCARSQTKLPSKSKPIVTDRRASREGLRTGRQDACRYDAARTHEPDLAWQGCACLSAVRNDGNAFPRVATALGRRALAGLVSGAAEEQTVPGRWQFRGREAGGKG